MKRILILLFVTLTCISGVHAQGVLKTESVSIFKNATAFFVKSGQVNTKDKKWEILGDTIPKALQGSLWFSSPINELLMVKSFQQDREIQTMAYQFSDLCLANDGKKIRILFTGDSSWVEGKIKVLQIPASAGNIPVQKNNSIVALIQNNGTTALYTVQQINALKRIEFIDFPNITNSSISKLPVLQTIFSSSKEKQPLQMMYLSQGLSWIPDYLIELVSDDKAVLKLRTTVLNQSEDFETNKLNLVAGVPNFRYATQIADFLQFISPGNFQPRSQAYSNARYQNFSSPMESKVDAAYADDYDASPLVAPAEGNEVEDLFYYSLDQISLKKGENALLDIFSAEVPIEHVYELVMAQNQPVYNSSYSFEEQKLPVVHTLKLTNTTDYVWTSAAAFVVKNDNKKWSPVSQDLLKYTAKKESVNLKLTEAPEVSVKFNEKEISRKVNEKSIKENQNNRFRYYDLVTIEAEVEVHNFKNKEIRLDLKRPVIGKLLESNEVWKLQPRMQAYDSYNSYTDVLWETKLKAGEKKKITCKYEFYVVHY